MYRAQTDAEVLFFEDHWHIFKYTVGQLPQVIFALWNTFEFDVWIDVTQAAWGLEFLRTSLLDQVAKHKLHFKAVLSVWQGSIWLEVYLNPEVPHVIKLNLLLLVADHETAGIKAELRQVQLSGEDVVVILLLTMLALGPALVLFIRAAGLRDVLTTVILCLVPA